MLSARQVSSHRIRYVMVLAGSLSLYEILTKYLGVYLVTVIILITLLLLMLLIKYVLEMSKEAVGNPWDVLNGTKTKQNLKQECQLLCYGSKI